MNMKAEIEVVTPAYAKQLLEQNPGNRRISQMVVGRYASDMKAGLWVNNGQGLVIDEAGNLMDGQHRCAAIILAQTPIAMVVVRGVPSDRFSTLDAGRTRTFSDVLHIRGHRNTFVVAAITRTALAYLTQRDVHRSSSRMAQDAFFADHPYIVDCAQAVAKTGGVLRAQAGSVLFLANESRKMDREAAEFISGTQSGEGLFSGDPRLALRNWYARTSSPGHHLPSSTIFGAVAKSWNAYARGDALSRIVVPSTVSRHTMPIYGFNPRLYSGVTADDLGMAPQRTNLPKTLATPTVSEVLGAA